MKESWLSSSNIFIGRDAAICKINHYGETSTPFLFISDFEGTGAFVLEPDEAAAEKFFFKIGEATNLTNPSQYTPVVSERHFQPVPIDPNLYTTAFGKVMRHLQRGDSYLLNLTFPTPMETDYSAHELFRTAHAPYKLLIRDEVVVFSPEPFIRMDQGVVRSFPMKGTIDASLPQAREMLLADKKETYEHNTIVDLIRNDLSMISTDVQVSRFRYLERIRTNRKDLWQMSSEIQGTLPENHWKHLGDDLFMLLPAGSVSGAPKERTVEIIRETESCPRDLYTGVFGYFDGHSFESSVMIRFIEFRNGGVYFRSGGGITALSDPDQEYRELNDKIYVPVI